MRSQRIEDNIKSSIQSIELLEIVDESNQHAGRTGQESHFKILVVSDFFQSKNRVQRQRGIYGILSQEFDNGLHALSLQLLTSEEYAQQKSSFETPQCAGKNKV